MEYVIIDKGDKSELVGIKHCGNGNDALYFTGTIEACMKEMYRREVVANIAGESKNPWP